MKCLQVHRGQFILIQHSGSMSCIAASSSWKNIDILNLAHRIYLHLPSVLTSIGSLDLYEDYLLKESTGQI